MPPGEQSPPVTWGVPVLAPAYGERSPEEYSEEEHVIGALSAFSVFGPPIGYI